MTNVRVKLFFGNLADGTTQEQLKRHFKERAPVFVVAKADFIRKPTTTYAFVHVEAIGSSVNVNETIGALDGSELNGSCIKVDLAKSSGSGRSFQTRELVYLERVHSPQLFTEIT